VLAVIDAATGLLPNAITYPAFPVVAGLLAASLGLGELGRVTNAEQVGVAGARLPSKCFLGVVACIGGQ